ncbi:hypothetical protein BpHYR1_033971 [Brachionus plicatilis]|uniref:Uncharacterized protein n=1 Tax=Brachionus plicatilis TaxID=10195 RepID=A0A3M7PJG3_BRAPC|nr:hypothetical protein BpHYR1_033971 [Brachionus plicatilis]
MNEIVSKLENLNLNLIVSSRKKKDGSESYILINDDYFEYKTAYTSNSGKITWRSIIHSIEEVFPEAEVCGCFFYLKKSIWRHVQENGLASSCIPNDLKKIFTYFEDNYIGGKKRTKVPSRKTPRFGLELWNCFERTRIGLPNNNLEGWHIALQSTIKSHPHLLSFINILKLEQSNTENNYIKLSTGQINKRKRKYVLLEEHITNIITDFNSEKIMEYLYNLSLIEY